MIGNAKNPLLLKAEQAIGAKVPPQQQKAFQRIILAGSKIMYSQQTSQMVLSELKTKGNPAEIIGTGVAKILGLLISQSKGTMPMQAAIPAAAVLLCEGLSFMEEAGKIKVDANMLTQATKAMMSGFLQMVKMTPEKLAQLMPKSKPAGIVGKAQGVPA